MVDVGGGGERAWPQPQRRKGEQAGAGADVGKVPHHHAFAAHQVEHREAPGGGGVLAGTERLAGGDGKVVHSRLGQRRIVRGADMEAPGADRLDP